MEGKLTGGPLVFFLLVLLPLIRAEGRDQTITPNEGSTAIVEATVSKLNQLAEKNADLRADNRFMRRIAWVETRDGAADHTYSVPTYHGGIWRVDQAVFDETKRMVNGLLYVRLFDDIEGLFCIRWSQTTWADCRKPLYSALAARLFFHGQTLIPQGLEDQADIWYQNYHAQPTDTKENFIAKVTELEQTGCNARGIDLVFVLDGSGSVGAEHFNTTKKFVLGMIDFFDIGPDKTKVGVIQYSGDARTELYLREFTEKAVLKGAVQNIVYMDGSTRTGDALDLMSNTAFLPENGARPISRGFPRVAVVVTDGKSHDSVDQPAERAREMSIVIFAIGVTDSVEDSELNAIANTPNETYVYHVDDFDAITNIAAALEYTTCGQATEIQNQTLSGTVNSNEIQNFEVLVPQNGATMTLNATQGSLIVYIDYSTPNPNEASHDDMLEANEGEGVVTIVFMPEDLNRTCTPESARKRRQADNRDGAEAGSFIGIVYVTIEGQQDTNDFVLTVTDGDVTDPSTTAVPLTTIMAAPTKEDSTNGCGFVAATMAYVLLHAAFSASII